ncbi:MAG: metallophosphoesterase [Bryobacteraceae bacterium]|nr:metallophosphoesterase [Bryobacteraceae bacterium]
MRRIVHISDLHFGAHDHRAIEPLRASIATYNPHLVACSGDLTMNAEGREFRQAREFLDRLPGALLVVPGNHDMPFFNPLRRLWTRLNLYKKIITPDLAPFFQDEEIAIAGVNTARVLRVRGGSISDAQVEELLERFHSVPPRLTRILVTHHPFDLPEEFRARELVKEAKAALGRMQCCVDLLLAGHMHISHAAPIAIRYAALESKAVFVQAGTAASIRERGEAKSYKVIDIEWPAVKIRRICWDEELEIFTQEKVFTFDIAERLEHTAGRVELDAP